MRTTRRARNSAGKYAQLVAEKSKARARDYMSHDLAGVNEDIRHASSFVDLRARLARRFEGMKPDAMARMIAKALIMAEMAGRKEVLEQL